MVLVVTACATYKDVRPGVDEVNRVAIRTDDVDGATRKCIKEARNYCHAHGDREPAFLNESSNYTGTMKESDFKNAKMVSHIAEGVGGAVWVFGGNIIRPLGAAAMIGGAIADQQIGKGYTVEMLFKCR